MNEKYKLDDDELEILNQMENGEFIEDLSEFENLKLAAKMVKDVLSRINTNRHQ